MHGPVLTSGQAGDTFELRYQFVEIGRVEIAGKWYRLGDYPWRIHLKVKKTTDDLDPFDRTKTISTPSAPLQWRDAGNITDGTNNDW
jgi:hypothetical protein